MAVISEHIEVPFAGPPFDAVCQDLEQMTGRLEAEDDWPAAQFQRLAEAGVLEWVIPPEYGGSGISAVELMAGYELLARECLVTTFVLTQRNGACQRIAGSKNKALKQELLPTLGRGAAFATLGISHLTTSRQHLKKPAVEVRQAGGRFILNGSVPWVTGARFADYVVTGGTCDDGRQVLIVVPAQAEGVVMQDPPRLLALNASQTGSVLLREVEVDERFLLAGPAEQVMKQGHGGGAGSLTTSALAVGAAAAALRRLKAESERRPDLVESYEKLAAERAVLSADLLAGAGGEPSASRPELTVESIRHRANSLVLRATQAYLAASKGAGFVAGHPAERAVREAMFFLVWSCPQPVLTAALREFACGFEPSG